MAFCFIAWLPLTNQHGQPHTFQCLLRCHCGWLLGPETPIKCLRFPGTHDDPYLQQWLSVMPGAERTPEQFGGGQMATSSAGTALLMNSRLLHCGGANLRDGARRRLFYMNLSLVKVRLVPKFLPKSMNVQWKMILWKTGSLQDFKVWQFPLPNMVMSHWTVQEECYQLFSLLPLMSPEVLAWYVYFRTGDKSNFCRCFSPNFSNSFRCQGHGRKLVIQTMDLLTAFTIP